MRNLDMTALRAFVAVADTGGVTRAAGYLHLTQSAVSMQLKRLEEMVQTNLLDRSARRIGLTSSGEQMLGYARKMLDLNDEIFGRLTHKAFEGEITLGVPHDVVYPAIPRVLQQFSAQYPKVKVQLISSYTLVLQRMFAQGECDIILTTEEHSPKRGETLAELPLIWVGAQEGEAWKSRPLRLAFEHNCMFRSDVQRKLDEAEIPWEMAVDSENSRTIEATVSADLAVTAALQGGSGPYMAPVEHGNALPELVSRKINLYVSEVAKGQAVEDLLRFIRASFCCL